MHSDFGWVNRYFPFSLLVKSNNLNAFLDYNSRQFTQKHTLVNSLHLSNYLLLTRTIYMPYNPCLTVTVAFKVKCVSLALQRRENARSLYLQALQHASAQLKTTLQLEFSRPQRSVTAGSSARDAARGCRGALEYYQVQPCA